MSINSFFNTRKSRNKNSIEPNQFKQDANPINHFAAQAPQPIYDTLTKPTVVVTTPSEQVQRNSILYYLSPIKKNVIEEEETTLPCRIRTNIPVSLLWKHILEEFDPDSQPNQFSLDSTSLKPNKNETIDISSRLENKRRFLQENETRCVRIRTCAYPTKILLNETMSFEDYLLEDIQEDLSRPLRTKCSSNQSNAFLLQIVDEIEYFI